MPLISKILLAPTLLCEGSLSMDLYAENLNSEFSRMPDVPLRESIEPSLAPTTSKVKRLLLRNISYPLAIRRKAAPGTILHVLDHSNGHLCRHHPNSVATCHDIAEYRETALNSRQLKHWKWRVEGMRAAKKIIAISHHTKADLVDLLRIPEERITVAHYGVDPLFRPWERADVVGDFPELDRPGLKILHIGSNIQRKNLPVLLRALGVLHQRGIEVWLVKVGHAFPKDQQRLIDEAGFSDRVIFLGNRRTDELPKIYSLSDLFVFPSTYEGFGRPILEAQACGTPVILARSSCLPEVGGAGALYFEPHSKEELAMRILEAAGASERSRLIAEGFKNAGLFTWRSHAEKVAAVYQEIL